MPAYNGNPIGRHVQQAVPGFPAYSLGTYDTTTANTEFRITAAVLTTNAATISVTLTAGNVPVAGALLSTQGVSNSVYNVTAVAITSVNIDAFLGTGTITFPLTHANVTAAAVTGFGVVQVPEVGEALVAGASSQIALQENTGAQNGRDVRFEITITSNPSCTITLQAATVDEDAKYTAITNAGTGGTAATFTVSAAGTQSFTAVDLIARFVRFSVGTVTGGTSPTIVGRVLV